jgi:AcrR family transcriptional regulator
LRGFNLANEVGAVESGGALPRDAKLMSKRSRPVRADARRNIDAVIKGAKEAFKTLGVDAPVRDIAQRAGVGMGTLYRHFPQRADLIAAVFRSEVDACAEAASTLAAEHGPAEALGRWMQRYAAYISTKRGLASALYSGDPTYASLPGYFEQKLVPALQALLNAAVAAGEARAGVNPYELLSAVGCLGMNVAAEGDGRVERAVALMVDGVRFGAKTNI